VGGTYGGGPPWKEQLRKEEGRLRCILDKASQEGNLGKEGGSKAVSEGNLRGKTPHKNRVKKGNGRGVPSVYF